MKQIVPKSLLICLLLSPLSAVGLINGTPLKVEELPDLVRLVFKNGSMCTGAFIDEYTILTAAHCLTKDQGENFHQLENILYINDSAIQVNQIQNITHPDYDHSWWPDHDIGIIKTSKNLSFKHNFSMELEKVPRVGTAHLYGCGIVEFTPKKRLRTEGQNQFLRLGQVLLFLGKSKNIQTELGTHTSVAPNDSGAPVLDLSTGRIIAIATQASSKESAEYGLPSISVATSIVNKSNQQFVSNHMGIISQP